MSVLTPDYERMQSLNAQQGNLRNQYKQLFENGDIDGAQTLVNNDNAQLAMNASKLNDLVDTINYMQQFWADDKEQFANWYLGMAQLPSAYDSNNTYHTGALVVYNGLPYFCISDNTTGTWDSSKWILLKPNETGVNFVGEYDSTASYNTDDLVWSNNNNIIEWKYYDGTDFIVVATTYPNIRYLSDTTQAIDGEVYITDYSEGGEG